MKNAGKNPHSATQASALKRCRVNSTYSRRNRTVQFQRTTPLNPSTLSEGNALPYVRACMTDRLP